MAALPKDAAFAGEAAPKLMGAVVKEALFAALVTLGLCIPILAVRTDQSFNNELVLVPRWDAVAIACALVDDAVECWTGGTDFDPLTEPPSRVAGLPAVTALSAGGACGVADGRAYCWDGNSATIAAVAAPWASGRRGSPPSRATTWVRRRSRRS